MVNCTLKTYNQDYNIVLQAIIERVPISYATYSWVNQESSKNYSQNLDSVIKQVARYISENPKTISAKTQTRIEEYLNTFEVSPDKSIDEFKLIFFTGMTLAQGLKDEGLLKEAKIILSSMVYLLDYRLFTIHVIREKLTERVLKMIRRGDLVDNTGKVGLYLIYKVLFNQVNGKNCQK